LRIAGLLFPISCSDGIQVEQKVKQLILTKKIKNLTITNNSKVTHAVVDSVLFQHQIMQIGKE
jgi:hypothetical protein